MLCLTCHNCLRTYLDYKFHAFTDAFTRWSCHSSTLLVMFSTHLPSQSLYFTLIPSQFHSSCHSLAMSRIHSLVRSPYTHHRTVEEGWRKCRLLCCGLSLPLSAVRVKCHDRRGSEQNKNQYLLRLVPFSSLLIPWTSSLSFLIHLLQCVKQEEKETLEKQRQRKTMAAIPCHLRRPPRQFQLSNSTAVCEVTNHGRRFIRAAWNARSLV
jgi:hypothetical protein